MEEKVKKKLGAKKRKYDEEDDKAWLQVGSASLSMCGRWCGASARKRVDTTR